MDLSDLGTLPIAVIGAFTAVASAVAAFLAWRATDAARIGPSHAGSREPYVNNRR